MQLDRHSVGTVRGEQETSVTGLGQWCHVVLSGHALPCQISQETEQGKSGSTPAENNSTSTEQCWEIDNAYNTDKVRPSDSNSSKTKQKRHYHAGTHTGEDQYCK